MNMSASVCGGQKHQLPWSWSHKKAVSLLMWVLGVNLGPLEEQKVRLTVEPSLQPLGDKFGFS